MSAEETTIVRLNAGFPDCDRSVRAQLFGVLVSLFVLPLVKHYHSDLYHDALWVDENITGPCTFYFSCDDCGTLIDMEREEVESRGNVWRIELVQVNISWNAHVTRLARG